MKLQEIKDQVANESGFKGWSDISLISTTNKLWPQVCQRYTTECVKASLAKAAENGRLNCNDYGIREDGSIGWVTTSVKPPFILDDGNNFEVDKSSITNPDNIVLL